MRKAIIGFVALLALVAFAWASSDPWKAKPYQQWDDKDVQKVLQNSPWSKVVSVDATWQGGASGSAAEPSATAPTSHTGPIGGGSSSGTSRPGGVGSSGAGSAPSSGGGGIGGVAPSGGGGDQQASFVVRWLSSRTIREALVRNAELSGRMNPQDAEKNLAQTPDVYQVSITGSQMTPFQSVQEAAIQEKTVLTTKRSKQKIEPSKVEFERSPDGNSISAVIISFPKKTASGEATIGADEKGVELSVSAGSTSIKTSFDLSKMYDAQGRDL
jgi:hypothetical protein